MKKKIIPFIAVFVLIILVILFMALSSLIEKYTPTKDRQDLNDYYDLASTEEAAIILDHTVLDIKGKVIDHTIYLDLNTVKEFNPRFYWDFNENKLLYTTASDVVSADAESKDYYVGKEIHSLDYVIVKADDSTAYIAIDFVKQYSDFAYRVYENPNRVVMTSEWGSYETAPVTKDTQLRYQGGIKSPILADITADTSVTVLEPDETWTKVATDDGIIGYVRSKLLGDIETAVSVSSYMEETYTHISKDFMINMGWHQVTSAAANDNIATVLTNSKGLNVISPTWFYLNDNEGNLASLADKNYVDYCHAHGVEVWALVSNLENKDISTTEVLSHTSHRETLVNNLITAAIQYDFDGINVDLEAIEPEAGDSYIQFIRELSLKCANNNIVLSVDNYVPTDYTAFYNRAEQALFADYVIIMGYDEHYSGSPEAGSVASIGFVRDGVSNTLKEVPANQIILGMPFFTRVWSETPLPDDAAAEENNGNDNADNGNGKEADNAENNDGDAAVTDSYQLFTLDSYATNMNEVTRLLYANGVTPIWSDTYGQYYAEYKNNDVTYKIWVENAASLEEKLKVLQENHLAGGSFWKLGLESADVWDTIIQYIH